jgi:hypothetical protein
VGRRCKGAGRRRRGLSLWIRGGEDGVMYLYICLDNV